ALLRRVLQEARAGSSPPLHRSAIRSCLPRYDGSWRLAKPRATAARQPFGLWRVGVGGEPREFEMARNATSAGEKAGPRKDGGAKPAAARQRRIQAKVEADDRRRPDKKSNGGAVQLGARKYPEPPFPKQHLPKPG